VTSVPERLDLVIITVSAPIVPQVLEECVATGAATFTSAARVRGDGNAGRQGIAGPNHGHCVERRLRIIGPNCMGFHVPSARIKMFDEMKEFDQGPSPSSPKRGHAQTYLFQAPEYGIGFSKMISYGNALTLDADDFLAYLAKDEETRLICAYVEGLKTPEVFSSKWTPYARRNRSSS